MSVEAFSMIQAQQRPPEAAPVIAVVAYNRAESLQRLLRSIARASYPTRPILYISLEGGATRDVLSVAHAFSSPNVDIRVTHNQKQLGLREHILKCGDLALEHGAVIVLEDDLYVDPLYYDYACAASAHYACSDAVAGIALYAPEYNEYAGLPFAPLNNGYSTYPMQVACSWGQCWTRQQWQHFRTWYATADSGTVASTAGLPQAVKDWPESSWKKYFAAYLVQTGRYFVYPYVSYSTNCGDAGGTHVKASTFLYQTHLPLGDRAAAPPQFAEVRGASVSYDAYMEPCGTFVYSALGLKAEDVTIDIYGIRDRKECGAKPFLLTRARCGSPVRFFPRGFRPVEQNLLHELEDECAARLFLYSGRDLGKASRTVADIESLSYYSGMQLMTRTLLKAIARALPSWVRDRISGR